MTNSLPLILGKWLAGLGQSGNSGKSDKKVKIPKEIEEIYKKVGKLRKELKKGKITEEEYRNGVQQLALEGEKIIQEKKITI